MGGRYTVEQRETQLIQDGGILDLVLGPSFFVCTGPAQDRAGREFMGRPFPDGQPDGGNPRCERRDRQANGDLTLEWWVSPESLLYGSVKNGFKAGGFNSDTSGEYDPEKIWAFALGSKNSFFDDRLVLNLEAFFYNYRDLQLVLVSGLSRRTDNADAEIGGVDLEFEAEPLPGLRLNGSASWTDPELSDYDAVDPIDVLIDIYCQSFRFCLPTDYSGQELSRAPELTLMLGGEYDFNLGRFGTLTPRVQHYWQDDTWYRSFNRTREDSGVNAPCPPEALSIRSICRPNGNLYNSAEARDLQRSYGLTDIKLSWVSPSERWRAEAFVTNVRDKVVYQNLLVGQPLLDSPQLAWYGAPRQYGFRIGVSY